MAGTQIKGIADAAVYPFEAGEAGDKVDIVLVRGVEAQTVTTEWENKGDDHISATGADFDGLDLTVRTAAFTPISVAALAGGTVTTTGTGATAVTKYVRNKDDVVPYVKIAGQAHAKDTDGGMGRITYPQCSWRGGPNFGMALDAFAELTFMFRAQPDADGDFYQYEAFTTYTALA